MATTVTTTTPAKTTPSATTPAPAGEGKFEWRKLPGRIWQALTRPSAQIVAAESRRRARLLAALLALLIPLGLMGTVVLPLLSTPGYNPLDDPFFYVAMSGLTVLAVSYGLSRSRHYEIGAVVALLIISIITLGGVTVFPQGIDTLLIYLTMDILLASLLLPARGTIALATLNIAAALLLPLFAPGIHLSDTINPLSFVLIMSALIIVAANIRARDLEQIEAQARDLSEAVEQANKANQLKDQFLATMSHELRTPLNAIIGFTEVMQMGLAGELAPQGRRAVDRVHYNSERLLQLIDDILDISKIEAGRVELLRRPFEVSELLDNVEKTMKEQTSEKGLKFVIDRDPALPSQLVGDRQRLEQIVLNLTSNALKFTEEGAITVSLKRLDDVEWSIAVTDTGVGIPPHAQDIIFEKFRQIDGTSRRAYGGTGLGLAITRELALLMDGSIKVKSKPGEGSTFTVTLPLVEPDRKGVR